MTNVKHMNQKIAYRNKLTKTVLSIEIRCFILVDEKTSLTCIVLLFIYALL